MIFQSFKMALKSILSHKMRSFLTMLGIIIGVFALVVLVSLVNGATSSITDTIAGLGTNQISVYIYDEGFRLEDLRELTEDEAIEAVAPYVESSALASSAVAQKNAQVIGTTAGLAQMQNMELESGRFLMTPDVDNHSYVCVINHDLATEVMGRTNVVGEYIKLNGQRFLIVGVLSENDNSIASYWGASYMAYIPHSTLVRISDVGRNISSFYVSAANDDMDACEEALKIRLAERLGDDPENPENFWLYNESEYAEAMQQVTATLSLLLGGIAAISLLVGGIGIMNIMLVSVTERTREIGIRKAIGAGRGTIMLQFLIESLMVSLMGCLIGIVFSGIALKLISTIGMSDFLDMGLDSGVHYSISPSIALISILFSIGIGVLFGLYPANKAAKMKPIDALRYN